MGGLHLSQKDCDLLAGLIKDFDLMTELDIDDPAYGLLGKILDTQPIE